MACVFNYYNLFNVCSATINLHYGVALVSNFFLRLASATSKGNTEFLIFRSWFATFYGLNEFPRDVTE
jgi:hypothetical protein